MRERLAAVAAAIVLAAATGCGGDGTDPEEYAAELDSGCQEAQSFYAGLPAKAAEDDLDTEQVMALAEDKADEIQAEVEALDPPDDLAEDHERLVALGEEEPPQGDPDEVIPYFEEFRDVYSALGADGCVEVEEKAIEDFRSTLEAPQTDPGEPGPG